jgi:UDP-N-acetylglucosamine 2-epimerase (non-hydrolysing)
MKLSFVFGTRPEVIKLYPLWLEAKKRGHTVQLVLTGQHLDLVTPLLSFFGMKPDLELRVMTPGQSLSTLSARLLQALDAAEKSIQADAIVVQGDTTSAFIGGYWAYCHRIPIAHVEAGLRTFDLSEPFPEEGNRQLLGRISQWHFPPTQAAMRNLRREGVQRDAIHCVGNTGVDALLLTLARLKKEPGLLSPAVAEFREMAAPLVLVTAHRRESFGAGFEGICDGLARLATARPDAILLYPVHPNPNVREPVARKLGNVRNIRLIDPLTYPDFVWMMHQASLIITDSGGVQEEAPSLGKRILVLRRKTERPEGVKAGFSKLVGCDPKKILSESIRNLKASKRFATANPYGDGKASRKILSVLERHFKRNRIKA